MRYYSLFFLILIFILNGCVQENDKSSSLLPREYYRTLMKNADIGVAIKETEDDITGIIPTIVMHEKISEAVYVTHEGKTYLGIKIKPYHRSARDEVLKEISTISAINVTNIIDDPRKYRQIEKLSREKKTRGVNEQWVENWKKFIGES